MTMKVAAQTTSFTTSALGAATLVIPVSFAGVSNYVGRFASTFDEVRVLSCKVKLIPLTATNGMTSFFWSERQPTTLTATSVTQRITRDISNSNGAGTGYTMTWKADGFQDLSWDPVSNPVAGAYFCALTDPTFGTTPSIAQLFIIQLELTVQLRGLANQ